MTNPSRLYDLFVSPGVDYAEIAVMDLDTVERHVKQLQARASIPLSSREIAVLVRGWARCQAIEDVVTRFLAKDATYRDLREVIR